MLRTASALPLSMALINWSARSRASDIAGTVACRPMWDLERRDAIAIATFNRPPRNFMSFAAMNELEQVLLGLVEDRDVAVIVLTGGVPGYFVAHADLDDLTLLAQGKPASGDPGAWGRTLR